MTTRIQAERVLFDVIKTDNVFAETSTNVDKPETSPKGDKQDRRRVDATYCPLCQGWVEVRLQPVRLHCTGCQREARP